MVWRRVEKFFLSTRAWGILIYWGCWVNSVCVWLSRFLGLCWKFAEYLRQITLLPSNFQVVCLQSQDNNTDCIMFRFPLTLTCRIYFKLRTKLCKHTIQKTHNFWNSSKSILGSSPVKKTHCPRSSWSVLKRGGGGGFTGKQFVPQNLKDCCGLTASS